MKKQAGKTGGSINKKLPKLNEVTKKKTDLQGVKNVQNLAKKTWKNTK